MIRVRTPSRLHFGLFSLPIDDGAAAAWPDRDGALTLPARRFGGVGVMIDQPGLVVRVEPATRWSAEGPLAVRALAFAQSVSLRIGAAQALHVVVEAAPPEHVGLGTGTQLGLAVAHAVTRLAEGRDRDAVELATLAGRGERSALGIHGFARGGFLVDGGQCSAGAIAPLVAQAAFPETWAILLVVPPGLQGTHGATERAAFQTLGEGSADLARTDVLCRLVLLGMLPALAERDLEAFGAAVFDFNRRVGEMFAPWQGGLYAHPRIEALVEDLRSSGHARGVGQSSWGPAVFAVVRADEAPELSEWLARRRAGAGCLRIATGVSNHGAVVE